MSNSKCPVCGNHSAWNASKDDLRCGPCHNFRVVGFTKYGALQIEVDFEEWADRTVSEIQAANNLETFRPWLHALKLAHAKKESGL
jgi:hypothetical protein